VHRAAVFAKPPVPGRVKTRLAPALAAEQACALYRGMLEDALEAAAASGADEAFLFWADGAADAAVPAHDPGGRAADHGAVAVRIPSRVSEKHQRGADLGARLADAFEALLVSPDDRAVVIGADCPSLDAATVDQAFAELARHDLVLGPTRDGGYYLIGLRRPVPALFEGIAWSTPAVLGGTLERADRAALETVLLAMRDDLDTFEDLQRAVAGVRRGARVGTATLTALRALGALPEA